MLAPMFFFLRSCAPSGGSSTGGPSLKVTRR